MPRIARKDLDTSFFHIMVQGIEKKYIFEKTIYKKKYLEFLFNQAEEFKINIIAYCIMGNHAHVLIYIEKIQDMSKYMHKVNGLFAQYYNFMENNRVGYVFRNRFTSEPLYNTQYLLNCIRYIHNNPVNAKMVCKPEEYNFSSYNEYKNHNGVAKNRLIYEMINIEEIICNEEEEYAFLDIDVNEKEIVYKVIKKYEKDFGITLSEIIKNEYILEKLIRQLKNNYKIRYSEMASFLGISLSSISRLVNKRSVPKNVKNDLFLPRPQTSQKEAK